MSKSRKLIVFVLVAVVASFFAVSAGAAWIDPPEANDTYITSNVGDVGGGGVWRAHYLITGDASGAITSKDHTFNDSGNDNAYAWQANTAPTTENPVWVKYDFGEEVTLNGMYLWNRTAALSEQNKGIQNFTISFSDDDDSWGNTTLQFSAARGGTSSQEFLFDDVTAQYARIDITSNHGAGGNTAANEIHFIPEPTTFGLLGLVGLVVLIRRRLYKA